MSSDDLHGKESGSRTCRGTRPAYSTCKTDQTIGGLNGCPGPTSRNDAILGSIAVAGTRAMASATGVGTTAVMEGAHKVAHCPWEQQKSQLDPFRMLPQGTSTGA